MNKRNLLIVTIVLVAIAAITQLVNNRERPSNDPKINKTLAAPDIIDTVDEVVLSDNEGSVHIVLKGDEWFIKEKDDFPADKQQLADLFEYLTTYHVASLTSTEKSKHAKFQVLNPEMASGSDQANAGKLVQLKKGGKEVFNLVAGKYRQKAANTSKPVDDGTYLRLNESPNIYLIKENLRLMTTADDWVKIDLFHIEEDEIKQIRFDTPGHRFSLDRSTKEDTLTVPYNTVTEKIDEYAKNGVLDELKPFMVEKVLSRSKQLEDILRLKAEITISLFDGKSIQFQILGDTTIDPTKEGDEAEKTVYYAKILPFADQASKEKWGTLERLGKTWMFQMNEWRAKEWVKTRSDFVSLITDED